MPTIPIFLKEKQYQRLRELAKIRNVKIAFLVREAVDLYLNAIKAEDIIGGLQRNLHKGRLKEEKHYI